MLLLGEIVESPTHMVATSKHADYELVVELSQNLYL